jgi:hypothetical protein
MPRVPLHALTWSQDEGSYTLYRQDQLVQQVEPRDEAAWLAWLREVSSFAFHGASGSLNVYLEARSPGGHYWYAYHSSQGRTRKRYLGRTETLSLARLEETAKTLLHRPDLAPVPALLSSKLSPPRLLTMLVERERLLSALDEALTTPLTLVCAPAGFGKTTLLSTWASPHKTQVAWLSLDELDTSATQKRVALIMALRRSEREVPGLGETTIALLQSTDTLKAFRQGLLSIHRGICQVLCSRAVRATTLYGEIVCLLTFQYIHNSRANIPLQICTKEGFSVRGDIAMITEQPPLTPDSTRHLQRPRCPCKAS